MTIEQAMARLGVTAATLSAAEKASLDDDGYVVLRGVFRPGLCAALIELFERRYVPSSLSQPPRGHDSRHAMLNDEPAACRACLSPPLLAAAHHLLRRRFFLFDVQGRDPVPGGGAQPMHSDWVEPGPSTIVIVLAFLEPFGPHNGATRVLPGSHKAKTAFGARAEYPGEVVIAGSPGDALVMHGDLGHSGTRNGSDGTRRNLQIGLHGHETYSASAERRDLGLYTADERYLLGQGE